MSATARTMAILATTLTFLAACTTTPGSSGSTSTGSTSTGTETAPTGSWEEVVKSDTQHVFIDTSSLKRSGDVVEASSKTNFATQMMTAGNKPYLSANNVYRLDCAQRKVALKSIRAYSESDLQGKVMQKANFYENNLQWMDAPTDSVFAHMIDFACKRG
jgi:hypothetical protein